MIDSHCHLTYIENIDSEIAEWKRKGVKAVVTSALDISEAKKSVSLRENYPDFVFVCLGLHPSDIDNFTGEKIKEYIEFIKKNREKIVAIGEVGLDYNWLKEKSKQEESKEIFVRFIELSKELDLPMVIHSRDAMRDTLDILKKQDAEKVMLHCFSGNEATLKIALELGYLISYATNICWTKKHPHLAAQTPLEQMLLETDSPWLDPDSREKNNRPWKIAKSAEIIAMIRNATREDVLSIASENARKFFKI